MPTVAERILDMKEAFAKRRFKLVGVMLGVETYLQLLEDYNKQRPTKMLVTEMYGLKLFVTDTTETIQPLFDVMQISDNVSLIQ